MSVSDEIKRRRHEELNECFNVVDTCLASYYGGATHMYRPIAGQLLPLDEWIDQSVTGYPLVLSLRELIRSIAEKGGGAHIDDRVNEALRQMQRTGPSGVGVHVLFTIAVGRCVQRIGLYYAQFRERFGYTGRLEDISFDTEHPTVKACAKVSEELEKGARSQIALTVLKRIQ